MATSPFAIAIAVAIRMIRRDAPCNDEQGRGLPIAAARRGFHNPAHDAIRGPLACFRSDWTSSSSSSSCLPSSPCSPASRPSAQGYKWTVERFGRYIRTLSPGLNLIVPYFDRIGRKMNMMEQVIEIPQQDVITKDNATVTVDGIAFFQVFDAAKASYEVSNLDHAIVQLTMTNIRSVMGAMDLDQMLSHRDEINERLLRVVDAAVSPWGVKVNRIEIKDIIPPANLVEAMGRQMKAERDKRAEILQAEGQRQSEILRAEGAKQSQILEAEGRREAAFRDAEGRERLAQAEAKATEMVSEAVARGDVAALNYFVAEKYLKAFAQLAESPNQKILMLPIEATSVLGALGGIGEIARATFGPDGRPPAPPASTTRRPTGAADKPWRRGRQTGRTDHDERTRRPWRMELVHPRRRAACARDHCARHLHAVAWALGHRGRADLARRSFGRGRPSWSRSRCSRSPRSCCGAASAGRRTRSARSPSSIGGRRDSSAGYSRWNGRSSTAPARSGSATPCGSVRGPDSPAGSRVKVSDADGPVLIVEPTRE